MLALAPDDWLVVAVRDGGAGALGHRQGPDEDELQERGQARRRRGRSRARSTSGSRSSPGSKNALKGVGFFLGGLLLTVTSFQTAMLLLAGDGRSRALVGTVPFMTGEPRPRRRQGEVPAHVLQQPRGQHPRRGAHLPLRLARRLVRRRPAGLPAHAARLDLLGGRHVHGGLGDRLRDRAGVGAAASCASAAPGAARPTGARPHGSRSCSRRSRPRSRSRSAPTSTRRS